jgi:hypothetical protein
LKKSYILQNINPVRQGQDVLKMPGQDIQLLPEDTFAAFTKGSDVLSKLTGSNNTSTPTSPSAEQPKIYPTREAQAD